MTEPTALAGTWSLTIANPVGKLPISISKAGRLPRSTVTGRREPARSA